MKFIKTLLIIFIASFTLASCATVPHHPKQYAYEVTITNISHGQHFAGVVVASGNKWEKLFTLGKSASPALEQLAESGITDKLMTMLKGSKDALDVVRSTDILHPGESVVLKVKTNHHNAHVTVAGMLIPTNDAFFAVNAEHIGLTLKPRVIYSPVYDAGTEMNSEKCWQIPGPFCKGQGASPKPGEGHVHIHQGIHSVGSQLKQSHHNWKNPIAKISIIRVRR